MGPHMPAEYRELVEKKLGVSERLERILQRRDLIGDWTPTLRAEYLALCDQEDALNQRLVLEGRIMGVEQRRCGQTMGRDVVSSSSTVISTPPTTSLMRL